MVDRVNTQTRSKVMASVRSKNTRLEKKVIQLLMEAGLGGFRRYPMRLPGKPDVIYAKQKTAVFIDSCFWHGCRFHLRMPASNVAYWRAKIERNMRRDTQARAALRRLGWRVIRVWEHELRDRHRLRSRLVNRIGVTGGRLHR